MIKLAEFGCDDSGLWVAALAVVKGDSAREEFSKFLGADQLAFFDGGLEQYVASLNGTNPSSDSAPT